MIEGQSPRRRKPRGYLGKGHETIGSDILAVMQMLKMPEQVLGAGPGAHTRRLGDLTQLGDRRIGRTTGRWRPFEHPATL